MTDDNMTLDEIKALNKSIKLICKQFVVNNRTDLIADVRDMMPNVQRFALWFLKETDIGVTSDEKGSMDAEILAILKDLTEALQYGDSVLMYDALDCGIGHFTGLFIPQEDMQDE